MPVEANVYKILGSHDRIARRLYISAMKDTVMLDFYQNGNLRDYVATHGPETLLTWTKQMIEAVEFIHSKGIRHSDVRLDQWLLNSAMNARLSDYNASGYDANPALGLQQQKALGNKCASHFMPRDPCEDNSIASDLFALGSTLYPLVHGSTPFAGIDEEIITARFALHRFLQVSDLRLGCLISGAWYGTFDSATRMLQFGGTACLL